MHNCVKVCGASCDKDFTDPSIFGYLDGCDGMNECSNFSENNPTGECMNQKSIILPTADIDPSKSLTSLTVLDLLQILQPIHAKIDKIDVEFAHRLGVLESRMKSVEVKNDILQHLTLLTEGIATMQKSIDRITSKDKEVNIMISDLAEGDIEVDDGEVISSDTDKFNYLLRSIGVHGISDETINDFRYQRIGVPNSDTTRVLKITVDKKKGAASTLILWHLWNLFR